MYGGEGNTWPCWFCRKPDCNAFDHEFDTPVHLDCIREWLIKDSVKQPDERSEAQFMVYLLEQAEQDTYRQQQLERAEDDEEFWASYEMPDFEPFDDDGSGELF